jgi:hypothetical protein
VGAKIGERLAVNEQKAHRVHMQRFNLKKLNEVESKEQYRVEISHRFAALENLDTEVNQPAHPQTDLFVMFGSAKQHSVQ